MGTTSSWFYNKFLSPKVSPVRSILRFKRGISWLCQMNQNTQLVPWMGCKWVLHIWRMSNNLLGMVIYGPLQGKIFQPYLFFLLFFVAITNLSIDPSQYHHFNSTDYWLKFSHGELLSINTWPIWTNIRVYIFDDSDNQPI